MTVDCVDFALASDAAGGHSHDNDDDALAIQDRHAPSSPSASASASSAAALTLEPSLAFLARRILPLAALHARCRAATEALARRGEGAVRLALAAGARAVLAEFSALVLQLEAAARRGATSSFAALAADATAAGRPPPLASRPGYSPASSAAPAPLLSLSLQQLWFLVQPALRTLSALAALLHRTRSARGGALLNVLIACAQEAAGDEAGRALADMLLARAAAPFMRQLDAWLFRGVLRDDDGEFMVQDRGAGAGSAPHSDGVVADGGASSSLFDSPRGLDGNASSSGGDAWGGDPLHGRFVLVPERTPAFLAPHASAILAAGRYLHVLRLAAPAAAAAAAAASAAVLLGTGPAQPGFGFGFGGATLPLDGTGVGGVDAAAAAAAAVGIYDAANPAAAAHAVLTGAMPPPRALLLPHSIATSSAAGAGSDLVAIGGGAIGGFAGSPRAPMGGTTAATGASSLVIGSHLQPASPADVRRREAAAAAAASAASGDGNSSIGDDGASISARSLASALGADGASRAASRGGTSAFSSAAVSQRPVALAPTAGALADALTPGRYASHGGGFRGGSSADAAGGAGLPGRAGAAQGSSAMITSSAAATAAVSAAAAAAAAAASSLNVLPFAAPIRFQGTDPAPYAAPIAAAAAAASRELLALFAAPPRPLGGTSSGGTTATATLSGLSLFHRLASLKGFFLLARGDFLSAFFDAAEGELQRELAPPGSSAAATAASSVSATGAGRRFGVGCGGKAAGAGAVSLQRLRHLLELSLRASSADSDPFRDDVAVALAPMTIGAQAAAFAAGQDALVEPGAGAGGAGGSSSVLNGQQQSAQQPVAAGASRGRLHGYNSFTLSVRPGFPLSLILTRPALARYQLLFRQLLFARWVERAVCRCWVAQQSCRELGGLRGTLALSLALRQRMLHFLQNISFFTLVEVIEPLWHAMASRMACAATIDDVIAAHEAFLEAAVADTLLGSPELLKLLTKLVTLCLHFANEIAGAIDAHRLSDAELDRRAGVNKASRRARQQVERGDYFTGPGSVAGGTASVAGSVVGGWTASVGGAGASPRETERGSDGGSDSDGNDDDGDGRSVASRRSTSARSVTSARSGATGRSLGLGLGLGLGAGTGAAAKASSKAGGKGAPSEKSGLSAAGAQATKERERRRARQRVQTEAMQHTLAQAGWQAMIVKSSRMFDALLREFLAALATRARDGGARSAHLQHLVARLDYNGFYSRSLFGSAA